MKNILLMGDSIRAGYDTYVRESFQGKANVYFPEGDNCRFAQFLLRNLHVWTEGMDVKSFDVIHWNAGLWDTLRIYEDECLTPIDAYVNFLERIQSRIEKIYPGAISIFATSTPVIESGYIADYEMRYNADVERYNKAAVQALTARGVIINDLYSLLKNVPDDYHSDQTHFYTAKATELIGGRVNEVLCSALGMDKGTLLSPNPDKFVVTGIKCDNELYVKKGDRYERIIGI